MEAATLPEEQTHRSQVAECLHCGAPVQQGQSFCCMGCQAAYDVLKGKAMSSNANQSLFSAFATHNEDGSFTLITSVKGVHCASCIRLIENALNEQDDVISARVNMSTERLVISWQGTKERADALAAIVIKLGYQLKACDSSDEKQEKTSHERLLLRCIAVAGFAMGNLMMISVGLWSSDADVMGMATKDLFHLISAMIALPAVLYAGRPFFYSAWSVLKEGHTNMDVPISIAVTLASTMSIVEAVTQGEHVYFDSAVMLLFFLLIGRYLDVRAKGKARESASQLLSKLHGSATILEHGIKKVIPIREVREGMIVAVAVGDNMPVDGEVIQGESEVDKSLITGETLPQAVHIGDKVFAGTVNLSAPIQVKVSKASEDSLLTDIVKLMEKAEQGQARYVRLADRVARLYTPVVHLLGLITFLMWWLVMGLAWQPSLLIAITVLIITCPCALALAVPVVQVLASGRLMKAGILLKSGDALEKLAEITTVVFDKTGTLTLGHPQLHEGQYQQDKMQMAASLATHSKHPLSQALCRAYEGALLELTHIEEIPGKGLQAQYEGKVIQLGSRAWCGNDRNDNKTFLELWLAVDSVPVADFTFSDPLRDDAKKVIEKCQEAGLSTVLLSGDRAEAVEHMAHEIGLKEYHGLLSPTQKCSDIEQRKSQGERVLMVGDGLNDAPSLATAHVSISPSTAIDITQNTADIVLQGSKLMAVINAWLIAKRSNRLVKQNFMLAFVYNIIAIPLAVMGHVTPLIAAIAMSGSSLIVIGNSFRLHRQKLD
ncbi:MAG: cadmium-translocating P-type ATPase [Rickettsiales bacterium]|nr:cadmium-translocating P-type ATPase [Rickettsiales bacterium]